MKIKKESLQTIFLQGLTSLNSFILVLTIQHYYGLIELGRYSVFLTFSLLICSIHMSKYISPVLALKKEMISNKGIIFYYFKKLFLIYFFSLISITFVFVNIIDKQIISFLLFSIVYIFLDFNKKTLIIFDKYFFLILLEMLFISLILFFFYFDIFSLSTLIIKLIITYTLILILTLLLLLKIYNQFSYLINSKINQKILFNLCDDGKSMFKINIIQLSISNFIMLTSVYFVSLTEFGLIRLVQNFTNIVNPLSNYIDLFLKPKMSREKISLDKFNFYINKLNLFLIPFLMLLSIIILYYLYSIKIELIFKNILTILTCLSISYLVVINSLFRSYLQVIRFSKNIFNAYKYALLTTCFVFLPFVYFFKGNGMLLTLLLVQFTILISMKINKNERIY